MSSIHPSKVLNINVGVLGHVDSGKTTLGAYLCACRHAVGAGVHLVRAFGSSGAEPVLVNGSA